MLRRAELEAAAARAGGARGIRARGRGDPRDQHLRRQPAEAEQLRSRGRDGKDQSHRRRVGARRRWWPRECRRRNRTARHPHRAVRSHVTGRGRGGVRAAGARTARRRRGWIHPRDVQRPRRDARRPARGARRVRSARRLSDDDRHRRTHLLRYRSRHVYEAARGLGRGRHRRELLGGTGGGARSGRKNGEGDRQADLGAAQRRPAQGRGGSQDLSRVARVHGELRAPHDRDGRAVRGRLLRLHARAYQEDSRLRGERRAPPAERGGVARPGTRARRRHADPPRREITVGGKARARRPRHERRDRAAQGRGSEADAGAVPCAQSRGRGCRQRARWPSCAESHGRAAVRATDRTRGGNRDGDSLLLPGSQSPRDAVRHHRRARRGTAQHPDHHRRSAQDGPVPGGNRRLRHRLDRSHESGLSSESGTRPRQQPSWRNDQVGDRRGRQSRRHRQGP